MIWPSRQAACCSGWDGRKWSTDNCPIPIALIISGRELIYVFLLPVRSRTPPRKIARHAPSQQFVSLLKLSTFTLRAVGDRRAPFPSILVGEKPMQTLLQDFRFS